MSGLFDERPDMMEWLNKKECNYNIWDVKMIKEK
jgi:hypothetical protein